MGFGPLPTGFKAFPDLYHRARNGNRSEQRGWVTLLVVNPLTQDQMQSIADKVEEVLRKGKRQ